MKVLYVVGTCLTKNTSANMSHNSYIQGLLENGCDVDIIMESDSWGEEDAGLPRWEKAHYYEYNSKSISDTLRNKAKKVPIVAKDADSIDVIDKSKNSKKSFKQNIKFKIRDILKNTFYFVFRPDELYPLDKTWLKTAVKFQNEVCYDLVVSNSSPAASHKLVDLLQKRGKIKFNRWVQIWEDPWYFDLYGNYSEKIKNEEYSLLQEASEIYYVSPLTLDYQKKYYSNCADKMKCIPLPYLKIEDLKEKNETGSFGYFGDFYSNTRNLQPFYQALCETGQKGYIYGDTDLRLASTDKIEVSGRVTLDKLAKIQSKVEILVHLCNLKGGQIPGKIYHYSATTKPILFIVDGTDEEKETIKTYFSKFERYCFCDNTVESIKAAIIEMSSDIEKYKGHVVEEFSPKQVVQKLLES